MLKMRRQKGIALITSLMALVLIFGLASLMFMRSLGEINHSKDNATITQTLLLAQAGARFGNSILQGAVQDDVHATVLAATAGSSSKWTFGGSGDAPDPETVSEELKDVAQNLQTLADTRFCDQSFSPQGTSGTISLQFYVTNTACGVTLPNSVKLTAGRFVSGAPRTSQPASATSVGLQTYSLPFVLVSTGVIGEYSRKVVIQGEYRFNEGTASFARYAYFTNMDAEQGLYFTGGTVIDGPTHTNSNFRFLKEPWFGGEVTSAGCQDAVSNTCNTKQAGAYFRGFYNWDTQFVKPENMSPNASNPEYWGWYHNGYGWTKRKATAPQLSEGVDWDANFVPLPDNNQNQRKAAKGEALTLAGLTIPSPTRGLYLNQDVHSIKLWAADNNGNPLTPNGTKANGAPKWTPANSKYQMIEVCSSSASTSCEYYRADEDGVLEIYNPAASSSVDPDGDGWTTDLDKNNTLIGEDTRPFNGVIFSEKTVERLTSLARSSINDPDTSPPAIASFSKITVASGDGDIRITGDLKYENPPLTGATHRDSNGNIVRATELDLGAVNVLGIYAQEGDVLVGNYNYDSTLNAPYDVTVQASLMSSEGQITVENATSGSGRGGFNLLGGMIQRTRGSFGQVVTATGQQLSGFSRVYTYDQRFRSGTAPPFFPTTNNGGNINTWPITFVEREQVF